MYVYVYVYVYTHTHKNLTNHWVQVLNRKVQCASTVLEMILLQYTVKYVFLFYVAYD